MRAQFVIASSSDGHFVALIRYKVKLKILTDEIPIDRNLLSIFILLILNLLIYCRGLQITKYVGVITMYDYE